MSASSDHAPADSNSANQTSPQIDSWTGGTPRTVADVYRFYGDYVKKLYAYVQASNELPQETLFELNAAFDHLTRITVLGEPEAEACQKAYSHLKRSCLDIFKLRVNQTTTQYRQLLRIDLSVIDNGRFTQNLNQLNQQIRTQATRARHQESLTDRDDAIPAFNLWQDVFMLCHRFETEFFLNPNLNWAETRQAANRARSLVTGAAVVLLVQAIIRITDGQPGIGVGFGIIATMTIAISFIWQMIDHHWIYRAGRAIASRIQRMRVHTRDALGLRLDRSENRPPGPRLPSGPSEDNASR